MKKESIFIVCLSKPLSSDYIYLTATDSLKSAEKYLRTKYPYMRKEDGFKQPYMVRDKGECCGVFVSEKSDFLSSASLLFIFRVS